ncbi:hypothetical protein ACJX0J_027791 [Zea mays]
MLLRMFMFPYSHDFSIMHFIHGDLFGELGVGASIWGFSFGSMNLGSIYSSIVDSEGTYLPCAIIFSFLPSFFVEVIGGNWLMTFDSYKLLILSFSFLLFVLGNIFAFLRLSDQLQNILLFCEVEAIGVNLLILILLMLPIKPSTIIGHYP